MPKRPIPIAPSEPPDLENLTDTLEAIRALLEKIAFDWSDLLIVQNQRRAVQDAYNELVDTGGAFERVRKELARNSPELQKKLVDAGLEESTRQLELKLSRGRTLWGAFFFGGGRKKLKRLLDWINTFLASLGAAIPGAEAIKEFKDALEEEFKDTED